MDAKPAPAAQVASGAKIYVSPGVKTILQAGTPGAARPVAREESDHPNFWPFIRILLALTDVLLVGLCGLLAWRAAGTLTFWEALGCTIAVGLGAALMCASVLIGREELSLRWTQQAAANGRGAAGRT